MLCPHKRAVAQRFSLAASTYDQVAHFQRTVGNHLLSLVPIAAPVSHILDLGSGTGHFSQQLKARFQPLCLTATDLALGMLQHAREYKRADRYICADMEHLPLATNSSNLIFSNLAVQWSLQFERTLTECQRVLKPGGMFVFSSVLDGSLLELKNSWAAVDKAVHINTFRTRQQYEQLCANSGFEILTNQEQGYCYHYNELKQLRHELRDLGANHLHAGRRSHAMTKAQWLALHAAYESLRQPNGLPLSWKIIYLVLKKLN